MKIVLIGPGILPIPPQGWGSVEKLIWLHHNELCTRGYQVEIINDKNTDCIAEQINKNDYDFIHCHYDAFAPDLVNKLKKPFCLTSHWGEVKEKEAWNYHASWWNPIFEGMLKCAGLICLTPEISKLYTSKGYNRFIDVLPVGTNVNDFAFDEISQTHLHGLCLGKIEPRKMQSELANLIENKCHIDFIGPNVDVRFMPNSTALYKGSWSREEVVQNLTKYKCLVLLSSGEGAPQVIPEALAAGLSICITETCAGNLDYNLPFINILPNDWYNNINLVINSVNRLCNENYKYRRQIRTYAQNRFDMACIINQYEKIIHRFIKETA